MFPIRDDNPHFLTPIVTYAVIAANVLIWLTVQGMGSEQAVARSVCELGLIPGELLGTLPDGTSFPLSPTTTCVIGGENAPFTPFTSMFLHGGWMHLLGNMWFMWIFGNNVEDSMGHARFIVFYVLSGLAAAGLQVATNPDSAIPMVGASGAIGGVMGAYVVLYPKVRVHLLLILGFYVTTIAVPAMFMLGYWFLIQFVSGAATIGAEGGGVAFWAHVGGFVAGAILVFPFRNPELLKRHPYFGWRSRSAGRNWQRLR